MNSILRSSVVVASSVVLATTLLASMLNATPLRYQIDLVVQSTSVGAPLAGATLKFDLTWDASTLPPPALPFIGSDWPTSNTTGSLTVSGSTAVDGVYSPTFPYPDGGSRWRTSNQGANGDSLTLPTMWFEIRGQTVEAGGVFSYVRFRDTFFEGGAPYYPKPFEPADVKWNASDVFSITSQTGPIWVAAAKPLSASARYVPEPSTLALGSVVCLSLAALRRRKPIG